jgi:Zn-dependent M28 family amino/carboxypeptidase
MRKRPWRSRPVYFSSTTGTRIGPLLRLADLLGVGSKVATRGADIKPCRTGLDFDGGRVGLARGQRVKGVLSMRRSGLTAIFIVLAFLVAAPSTWAAPGSGSLRRAVTVEAILAHEAKFQHFGELSTTEFGHPTRVDGSVGFRRSVHYVRNQLEDAGYRVTVQRFRFDRFVENTAPVFEQVTPDKTYAEETDFFTMDYSGSGDVTANVQEVTNNQFPPAAEPSSAAGCEAADFADFTPGNIALIQRGTCTFREKADFALDAGAVGVIIFNEGQPGREEALAGTLSPPQMEIPVIGTSFAVGEELHTLLGTGPVTVHIVVDASIVDTPSANVIADSKTGNPRDTVVVGAHLDSVEPGPGINDNGSGSASILEVAKQMANLNITPENRVRFAFWGGEEFGLLGSEHYVSSLSTRQLNKIMLNLNFDMVGSPNFVRFVYDGNGSATGTAGPPGSGKIERFFLNYFEHQGLATDPTPFDGRSDYGPFIDRGIPAGGLFTGAEGVKTAEQAAVYGGTAGEPYDPCYHQLCDQYPDNLNVTVLDQMSDAIAHVVFRFANQDL